MKKWTTATYATVSALFSLVFLSLIVRARYAFGDWPRLSWRDPSYLAKNAPHDVLWSYFSYEAHADLAVVLLLTFLVFVLLSPLLIFAFRQQGIARQLLKYGLILAPGLTLLLANNARFLIWFLD